MNHRGTEAQSEDEKDPLNARDISLVCSLCLCASVVRFLVFGVVAVAVSSESGP